MGDETKRTELEKGNTQPLRDTRKPSSAETVARETSEAGQMPRSEREIAPPQTEEATEGRR